MSEDLELKQALESAFGPGALEAVMDAVPVIEPTDPDLALSTEDQQTVASAVERVESTEPEASTLLIAITGEIRFGLRIEHVSEICQLPALSRVFRGPSWFRGLANVRGTAVPAIDLADYLQLPETQNQLQRRLIVLQTAAHSFPVGLIVDEVTGLSQITSWIDSGDEPCIEQWGECDGESTAVIDVDQLFSFEHAGIQLRSS